MPKNKNIFVCSNCGYESAKWLGKCPVCNEWDTFKELKIEDTINTKTSINEIKQPKTILEINEDNIEKIYTGIKEFDNVVGGGITNGSIILIGGAPGIGKSTLLLQIANNLSKNKTILYVSGEENLSQIKNRTKRIGSFNSNVKFLDETYIYNICNVVLNIKPDVLIIDSIQTITSDISQNKMFGSIADIKNIAQILFRLAKDNNITTIIVGHITKDGLVAGPKALEHIVDTVLYFEDDQYKNYRLLRCKKNRFGSNNELAIFQMEPNGLQDVNNASNIFLDNRPNDATGCVISCTIDANRPIFIEVQALVTKSVYGMAKRTVSGSDYTRVNLLIAIIEKKLNIPLFEYDIYINITGGLKIKDTSLDLAIIMAILSSYKNLALGDDCIYCGEVGLNGEVRGISNVDLRINEAIKLGFKRIFLPKINVDNYKKDEVKNQKIQIKSISNISQ